MFVCLFTTLKSSVPETCSNNLSEVSIYEGFTTNTKSGEYLLYLPP